MWLVAAGFAIAIALSFRTDPVGARDMPLALAFGVGFGLPLILVGVPIRVALVLAGRRSLD